MPELKNCPFCGGSARHWSYGIGCINCGVFFGGSYANESHAAKWNQRATAQDKEG